MKTNLTHSPTTSLLVTLAESDTANNNTQWVHVLPLGEFSAVDGRGPFVVNDPEKILKTTLGRAGSRKIPVDYDHQIGKTEINGQPGIAAGWFSEFEVRDNGIWGLVEWTDKAKAHLDAKEYRYLSPSLSHDTSGIVTAIKRAALVNNPALELTALASEQSSDLQVELAETQAQLKEALAQVELSKKESKAKEIESLVHMAAVEGRIMPFQKEFATELCAIDTNLFNQFVKMVEGNNLPKFKEFGYGESQEHIQDLSEYDKTVCEDLGLTNEEFTQLGKSNDR